MIWCPIYVSLLQKVICLFTDRQSSCELQTNRDSRHWVCLYWGLNVAKGSKELNDAQFKKKKCPDWCTKLQQFPLMLNQYPGNIPGVCIIIHTNWALLEILARIQQVACARFKPDLLRICRPWTGMGLTLFYLLIFRSNPLLYIIHSSFIVLLQSVPSP